MVRLAAKAPRGDPGSFRSCNRPTTAVCRESVPAIPDGVRSGRSLRNLGPGLAMLRRPRMSTISVLAVALVIVAASFKAGSLAVFTDSQVVAANTFTAGTVDI